MGELDGLALGHAVSDPTHGSAGVEGDRVALDQGVGGTYRSSLKAPQELRVLASDNPLPVL
jgi:hypothetical protein